MITFKKSSISNKFVLALVLLALFPLFSFAETVVRTGNSVSIGIDQTVENDLYVGAGSIALSGKVAADTYMVGGSVTVNGPVGADLTVVGGTVQTHSLVGDDVRIIGGDVVIAGEVGGDVFVVGGHLKLLSSAKVAGNLYFYGGEAEIEGSVAGSVMGKAEEFKFDGVAGGADIVADKVILGSRANISGDLRYQSGDEINRAIGSTVGGNVVAVAADEQVKTSQGNPSWIIFVVWILTSLSIFLIGKRFLAKLLKTLESEPVRVGLVGLLASLASPAVAMILIVSIIGAWVGIAILIFTILLFIVALAVLPILLGGYLYKFYKSNSQINITSVLIGLVMVFLLTKLPFLGGVIIFLGLVFTIGALVQVGYRLLKGSV